MAEPAWVTHAWDALFILLGVVVMETGWRLFGEPHDTSCGVCGTTRADIGDCRRERVG